MLLKLYKARDHSDGMTLKEIMAAIQQLEDFCDNEIHLLEASDENAPTTHQQDTELIDDDEGSIYSADETHFSFPFEEGGAPITRISPVTYEEYSLFGGIVTYHRPLTSLQ